MFKSIEYRLNDLNGNELSVYRDSLHLVIYKSDMENIEIDEYELDDLISAIRNVKKEIKIAKKQREKDNAKV